MIMKEHTHTFEFKDKLQPRADSLTRSWSFHNHPILNSQDPGSRSIYPIFVRIGCGNLLLKCVRITHSGRKDRFISGGAWARAVWVDLTLPGVLIAFTVTQGSCKKSALKGSLHSSPWMVPDLIPSFRATINKELFMWSGQQAQK